MCVKSDLGTCKMTLRSERLAPCLTWPCQTPGQLEGCLPTTLRQGRSRQKEVLLCSFE